MGDDREKHDGASRVGGGAGVFMGGQAVFSLSIVHAALPPYLTQNHRATSQCENSPPRGLRVQRASHAASST
eukprot:scaffold141590_cov75-Phaeocystis_antarctica.AAC.1